MPEHSISDSIITHLNAQEPWPDNVKLFQPYEVEQILLPDNASCLAVQAFLKMCNLPFEVEMRWNAEWMSPSGRVPFIKCGAFVVSELEPIVQFAANKGVSLCGRLATEDKAEMRAYMSLITNVLVNAELYVSWVDNETYNAVTRVRNSSVYPWPLGWLQTRAKRNVVAKRLKALHWYDKTLDQVLADVEQCCNSLSQRLGDKDYFFGTPTPLDALVYGHMRALLAARGPKAAVMIRPISSSLLRHVLRVAHLTDMKLTPQEEYLVTQAFQISYRRRLSPDRASSERSARMRRSKVSMRNTSKESLRRDTFGFKPFACKQVVMMTSKDGNITCRYNDIRHKIESIDEEQYAYVVEIIEDILDKVEECAFDEFNEKIDIDKHDFEVIAFPKQSEVNDVEEQDTTATTLSVGTDEDINVIDVNEGDMDSDEVVMNKHLTCQIVVDLDDSFLHENCLSPVRTDSSKNNELRDFVSVTSSGDKGSRTVSVNSSCKSCKSNKSPKGVMSNTSSRSVKSKSSRYSTAPRNWTLLSSDMSSPS